MRGAIVVLAGVMGAALLSPVAVFAQQQQDSYYDIEVQDYPPWDPPVDPHGQPYYRDADPDYRRKFEANVEAYKKQVKSQHSGGHEKPSYAPEDIAGLEERARGGDKFALRTLGDGYASGNGLPKDEAKALEWYEMGARLGHNEFFSRIGNLYRERYEPPKSMMERLNSYMSPQTNTIERDDRVALAWYEKGRVWDDAESLMALSDFYARGLGGVPADKEEARALRLRGMQLLAQEDERSARDFESAARRYAEKMTPFNPQNQNDALAQPHSAMSAGGLQVSIGGRTCSYYQSQTQVEGYDFLYQAQCDGILSANATSEQVMLPGLLCDVAKGKQTASVLLKCNAVGGETITIAGLECSLRSEPADKGFMAVYGAYCQGEAQPTREKVAYRGLECIPNRVYTEGGKHYTLYCNPPKAEAPLMQQAKPAERDQPVTIGNFACVASAQRETATTRRMTYHVNCGGIAQPAKVGPQVPRLIPFGEYLCDVTPVEGQEKVDFTMDCKK